VTHDTIEELQTALEQDPLGRRRATRRALSRVIVDEMFQFVGLLTPDGTLVEANSAALAAGGLRREDVIGRPFWHAHWWRISSQARRQLRSAVARAAKGELVRYDVEVLAGAAGSATIPIDFNVRPVCDRDGNTAFLVVEGRDIAEKQAAEIELAAQAAELRGLNERLTVADRLRTEFVANVSHELRTPLAVVLHDARALEHHPDLAVVRRAASIREQSTQLRELVDDLLEVARIDHGATSLTREPTDVVALVGRVCGPFERLLRDRGGRLAVATPAAARAMLDGERLETVVRNLLANAVKFSPTDGHIRVTLRTAGGDLVLEVADDGPGIPPEARELVFERFAQLDGGARRRRGGTGLGLALVRELVLLHDGVVTVDDAPEGGALFRVVLPWVHTDETPVTREAAAAEAVAPELPSGTGAGVVRPPRTGRPLVLVADDHPDVRRALAEVLSDYDVALAPDGDAALALARELEPDVVLTDVMMPGTSGEDLVAALRAEPAFDDVPIIVVSARADRDLRLRLLELGAQDHLPKPFDASEVRLRVGNLLGRAQEARRAKRAELRLAGFFEHAPHGMVATDVEGVVADVNAAFCELVGRSRGTLLGRHVTELIEPDDPDEMPEARRSLADLVAGRRASYRAERRLRHARGHEVWVDVTVTAVEGERGDVLLAQVVDTTERRRFEAELRRLADHDALTGLLNRRAFRERLDEHLALARRYGPEGCVLLLDLDHFKETNDTLGHAAGDDLIVAVAQALRRRVRAVDVLARLGGDEFAVLLARAGVQDAIAVGDDLRDAVRVAVAPFESGHEPVTASIGVAEIRSGEAVGDLLARADLAMYDAKDAGRDSTRAYATAEHARPRTLARIDWGRRLRNALNEGRLDVLAQPLVPLQPDGVPRLELLVRIVEDGELVVPAKFLYVAERLGLVGRIDEWVARRAVDLLAEHRHDLPDLRLNVNLSALSVANGVAGGIRDLLASRPEVPAQHLTFEITETAAISHVDIARRGVQRLRAAGCRVAIDDFGAGFGSFAYLKHLPWDEVKVDGQFVATVLDGRLDRLVVEAVTGVAAGLGKTVVAECVPDDATVDFLREAGVHYAQGFHLGEPVPVGEALAALLTPGRRPAVGGPAARRAS
jgi:diguanylate cyclase (GGDEF)-like protein/PAS domain S-box-containing protein